MSAWTEARDRQMIADGWVRRPDGYWEQPKVKLGPNYGTAPTPPLPPMPFKTMKRIPKPLLNATEERWATIMEKDRGIVGIVKQGITLRLDPPFKSYRPDLAYFHESHQLTFVEIKGPHRFREKGIAKAALAAKTYPQFRFELVEWTGKEWKESVLTP